MQGISENLGDAPNASPIEQATYLTPEQQKLATQTFETQVEPLRRGFKERLETGVEGLARRGVAFGGVGSQGLADIFEAQTQAEAQLAGQIATGLGARSLDQAFQAAEAAKQREFAKGERLGTQEFATKERTGAESFVESQAKLDRDQRIKELDTTQEDREDLFKLNEKLEKDLLDIKNTFTTSEREKIEEYNEEFQDAGFDQEFDILKYKTQQERLNRNEEGILNLINSGQVTTENADQIIGAIFENVLTNDEGEFEGIQFTPADELNLQRTAEQAGLTVDEYTRLRRTLGLKQRAVVYDELVNFVFSPKVMQQQQERLARIASGEDVEELDTGDGSYTYSGYGPFQGTLREDFDTSPKPSFSDITDSLGSTTTTGESIGSNIKGLF